MRTSSGLILSGYVGVGVGCSMTLAGWVATLWRLTSSYRVCRTRGGRV